MFILLLLIVILMFAGLPSWPWGERLGYGYAPSGMLGVILLVLLLYIVFSGHRYF